MCHWQMGQSTNYIYLRAPNERSPVVTILHYHVSRHIDVLTTAIASCMGGYAILHNGLLE